MVALLDINMLIALFDGAHLHHAKAHDWMTANKVQGWATCPLTENGCVRILSQPAYPGSLPITEIIRRLLAATMNAAHRWWADDISLCDANRFYHNFIPTPKLLTDLYLLGLAVKNKGRFVTLDQGIPLAAVKGARSDQLVVL